MGTPSELPTSRCLHKVKVGRPENFKIVKLSAFAKVLDVWLTETSRVMHYKGYEMELIMTS